MQDTEQIYQMDNDAVNFKKEIGRYLSFWPYLLLIVLFSILSTYLYLRYTNYSFKTTTIIEILDESQDTEMALPTELTVFNRSMINLENEINRLNSYSLNEAVVSEIKANVMFIHVGRIKNKLTTSKQWYDEYDLEFKIDTELIDQVISYSFTTDDNKLLINIYDSANNLIRSEKFNSLSTLSKTHNLPFELTIISDGDLSMGRKLKLTPVTNKVVEFKSKLEILPLGKDSDQLSLTLTYQNDEIAQNYLNTLTKLFDNDGILDKKLEHNRTIEFVNVREKILRNDLSQIELRKQNYKQENNISDVSLDANNNINLKYTYNSEIFQLESQKQISEYLTELISESDYNYIPINIGLENFDLNNMINEYNNMISERFRFLNESGSNNYLVKSLEPQLKKLIQNISASLVNFSNSLNLKLENLKMKESEFDNEYNRVPENEKTLRGIERELSIKEALYLLLLQKREEASINLAVVKPTIKVIDYAITDPFSKKPNKALYYISFTAISIFLYIIILYLWFYMDNKIHNRDELLKVINNDIPIIAEIPFIKDIDKIKSNQNLRSVISESIRMLLSNLRFTSMHKLDSANLAQTIIFTSSIKGEGKTLASVNTALALATDINKDKKVLLMGTDLRNPQIHKNFGVNRDLKGVSEIIYNNDCKNYNDYVKTFDNLDVLFSGAIPPNPTALLSSDIFKNLISILKNQYDFIIIDSAPCLLVSDTFQYIDLADSIVYLFRSNFTDSKIIDFINETYEAKKIKNFNLVFNAVGNSAAYGYKYGYQYGYKYSYKYGYNYGYGYGYASD